MEHQQAVVNTGPSRKMCDDLPRLDRGRPDITKIVVHYSRAGRDYTVTVTNPEEYWAIFFDENTAKAFQRIINQPCQGKPGGISDPQRLLVPAGTDEAEAEESDDGTQAQASQDGEKRMLAMRKRAVEPDLCYYVNGVWHCW